MADLMAYLLSIRRGAHQPAAQKGSARKVD
jgi:hypothetical protein